MKRSKTVGAVLEALQRRVAEQAAAQRDARRAALDAIQPGLTWHVGVTAIGRERAVEAALREAGAVAFSPRETVSIGDRARRRDVERALMPRYVFFALTGDMIGRALLRPARSGQGVSVRCGGLVDPGRAARAFCRAVPEDRGVMGVDGLEAVLSEAGESAPRWRVVPAEAVGALVSAERAGMFDRTETTRRARREEAAVRLKAGDSVKVVDGWFAGRMARVVKVKPANRMTVLLELFGSGLRAELRFDSLAISA